MNILNLVSCPTLRAAGYKTSLSRDDCIFVEEAETKNQFEIWEIGDWLQFRIIIFSYGNDISSQLKEPILTSINQLHDYAFGYRFVLTGAGDLVIVTDVLAKELPLSQVVILLDQAQFLVDSLLDFFSKLGENSNPITADIIDAIFERESSLN